MQLSIPSSFINKLSKKFNDTKKYEVSLKYLRSKTSSWASDDSVVKIDTIYLENDVVKEIISLTDLHKNIKGVVYLKKQLTYWLKIKDNVEGVKVRNVKALEGALKEYIRPSKYHFLFIKKSDGNFVPYIVHSIVFRAAQSLRGGGFTPQHTTMALSCSSRGELTTKNITFYNRDLVGGKTVKILLEGKGYYLETEELIADYLVEVKQYHIWRGMIGEQFSGIGFGYGGDRWEREIETLAVEDVSSKLVVDLHKKESEMDYIENQLPWEVVSKEKKIIEEFEDEVREEYYDEDEDEVEASSGSVVVPVHPYVYLFNLDTHQYVFAHINDIKPYVYDDTIINKLILPEDQKSLIDILLEGTDDIMEDIVKGKTGGIIVMSTGVPGIGKCLGKGTPILMYDGGIKKVEDVEEGEFVMGPDSKPRKVFGVTNGREKLYRVTPIKGEPYIVNKSHILSLKKYLPSGKHKIINISVKDYLSKGFSRTYMRGWRTGVDFKNKKTPIDPYFIGLWLGDGSSNNTTITNTDEEIIKYIYAIAKKEKLEIKNYDKSKIMYTFSSKYIKGQRRNNSIRSILRRLNLLDNKHIPNIYKINDRETRLQVLAGLLDSDGHKSASNCYQIVNKSEILSNDIVYLCRSLGFAAYKRSIMCYATNTKKKTKRKYYTITISGKLSEIPMKLKRKKCNVRRQRKSVLVIGIKIRSIGEGEYYGFGVSGDGLFLLGDFTVTHNTLTAEVYSEKVRRPLYKVQSSQLGINVTDLEENLKEVLERASRWRAILLIDECDVYVHERGDDLVQNAIVGVFLRVLEYYKGVLFMASNREVIIDDAILSRCTAHIHYKKHSKDDLLQIWKVLSTQLKVEITDKVINQVVEVYPFMAGRDVKTAIKLAKLIARRRKQVIDLDLIKYVSTFQDFDKSNIESPTK